MRRLSSPGKLRDISDAPMAATERVKLAGMSVSNDSVKVRVGAPELSSSVWPGWTVTDAALNDDFTPEGSPETLRS